MRLIVLFLLFAAALLPQHASYFAPRVRYKVEPQYTEDARQSRIQGTVVLYTRVGTDGKAHDIRVVRGLGHGLDQKAVECLERWEFAPALQDDEPVATAASVEINFRLD
jgi:periplasmic protein TonB